MMTKKKAIILLSAVLIAGGCTMAPKYTKPESPVAEIWPAGPAYENVLDVDTEACKGWQDFFTDERLRKVIETAFENNRDLRLAALNVQQARGLYGIQRSELFPAVNATANGSKKRTPADLSSSGKAYTSEQYDVNLGIFAWEVDFFGRIRSLKDQALEQYLATEQAQRSAMILLASSVADAYLVLAADRENLALAETTFNAQKESYDLIKRRFDIGLASELDLNRAQTQVDIARVDMASYTQMVALDINALNLLVGTATPVPEELLPSDLAGVVPLKDISVGLPSDVLLNRPDIIQAENLLKAANANIGAARAALFPRISLTTSIGTASSELSGLFDSGQDTWTFAPGITLPIFDARLWSALDVTKAQKEIAVVQYEKAIQTAFREVSDALAVRGTVDRQISAQQSLTRAAERTYLLSDKRYKKGIDSYLGVLDAQRSFYSAQQGLVSFQLAKLVNQVKFYKVLGGISQYPARGFEGETI